MLEFLILLRPARRDMLVTGPTPEEQSAVAQHFAYLVQLHKQRVLAFAGRTQDNNEQTLGVAVIRCDSAKAAEDVLSADPAILGKVFTGTIQPFGFAVGGEGVWG